jgi:hypothetical protein
MVKARKQLRMTSWPDTITVAVGERSGTCVTAAALCHKIRTPNKTKKWILFEYIGLELTPVSKPFNTKEQAEKERLKYRSECVRGLGWV